MLIVALQPKSLQIGERAMDFAAPAEDLGRDMPGGVVYSRSVAGPQKRGKAFGMRSRSSKRAFDDDRALLP